MATNRHQPTWHEEARASLLAVVGLFEAKPVIPVQQPEVVLDTHTAEGLGAVQEPILKGRRELLDGEKNEAVAKMMRCEARNQPNLLTRDSRDSAS